MPEGLVVIRNIRVVARLMAYSMALYGDLP